MASFLLLFFLLVTFSHGFTLLFVKKRQQNSYQWRKLLWRFHLLINGLLWTLFVLWIGLIQFSQSTVYFPPWVKGVGVLFVIIGAFLSGMSFRILGLKQAFGERIFFPEKRLRWISSGIYKYIKNPIYDGFILIFIGLGLWREITIDFYLAGVSLLLLNLFLASIENSRKTIS